MDPELNTPSLVKSFEKRLMGTSKNYPFMLRQAQHERMVERLDRNQPDYDMQEHRPVGICMHMFEGLNMRTVFVEKAEAALRNA